MAPDISKKTEEKPGLDGLMPPPPVPMPDEVYERYKGPGELAVSVTRASILGVAGWFVGKMIGDWGSHDQVTKAAKYKPLKGRTLGGMFATAGALMGLYSAARESRDAHRQHHNLQRAVMEIHEENVELRHALHEARVALHLPEISIAEPKPDAKMDAAFANESVAPETKVDAESVSVAGMQNAEGKQAAAL